MMASSLPVLVIGTGITAGATVLALRRANRPVHWYITTPSPYEDAEVVPGLIIAMDKSYLDSLRDWMDTWSIPAHLIHQTTCEDMTGKIQHAGVVDVRGLATAFHQAALASGEPNEEGPHGFGFEWDTTTRPHQLLGMTRTDGSTILASDVVLTLDARPLHCARTEQRTEHDAQVRIIAADEYAPVYRVPLGDQVYIMEQPQPQPTSLQPGVRPEDRYHTHRQDWAIERASPGPLVSTIAGGNGLLALPSLTGDLLLSQVQRGSDAD
jgi:hypothetical protein